MTPPKQWSRLKAGAARRLVWGVRTNGWHEGRLACAPVIDRHGCSNVRFTPETALPERVGELRLRAKGQHSPHLMLARITSGESTSVLGWRRDPRIRAIMRQNRRPGLHIGRSGYSRFSPKSDAPPGSGMRAYRQKSRTGIGWAGFSHRRPVQRRSRGFEYQSRQWIDRSERPGSLAG